jgi:dUTP pyrophosphatase
MEKKVTFEQYEEVIVKFVDLNGGCLMPRKGTSGSAGYDIYSNDNFVLYPDTSRVISTGLSIEMPQHIFGLLKSRSGLAFKNNITIFEGVIDSDFRGEIKIKITNEGELAREFFECDAIAQIIFFRTPDMLLLKVEKLNETARGNKGFGSTSALCNGERH